MNHYVRLGIYAVVGAVSFVLMVLGYISSAHVDQAFVLVGQILGLAGSGLALANLTPKNVMKVPMVLEAQAGPLPSSVTVTRAPWLAEEQ